MSKQLSSISTNWPSDAMPKHWVESLFEKMLFEYGKKFSDQWGGADAEGLKLHWGHRLADLMPNELKRGVSLLDSRDWPPSLPEFKKMCRPGVDSVVAYYEAVAGVQARSRGEMGEWSHPGIFWAAAPMTFDLLNQTFSQVKARWELALAAQMEKGEWAEIKAPLIELPAPAISKEKAAEVLAEIGAGAVLVPKTDHRRWAKLIIECEKRGDKTLSALQVRFAKEALEEKRP